MYQSLFLKNLRRLNFYENAVLISTEKGVLIFIEGQQNKKGSRKKTNQAFNKNGIKLIYALLLDDALGNYN